MFGFWILAALLLLAAYAFFVPSLRGRLRSEAISRQKLNLELHRQRREEIIGEAGGEDRDSLVAELDKDLLGDLAQLESRPAVKAGGRGALLAALAAAPILAFVVYSQLGRPDLADFSAAPVATAESNGMAGELQTMVDRLAQRLEKEPGDIKGWLLLARSYSQIEQFDKALGAYERAMALDPKNLDIKGFYAEGLAQANGGTFKGRPTEIADEILAVDPQHPGGLWVAAAAAAERGEPDKAVAQLEKLKSKYPADSEDAKFIAGVIAKVKGQPVPDESVETASAPEAGKPQKSIRVTVTLAENFKGRTGPSDTVFVFARAAKGPPMPLAIVKKQVKDLPLEVTLDDTMGMVQGMNLSAFDELVIGARVSKSGNALPAPGDLQGLSAPTKVENGKGYAVEIHDQVN